MTDAANDSPDLVIALAPLDERPVNTRYPQMLGAIGGATVLLPPAPVRGEQRIPSDVNAVDAWIREAATQADGLIASADYVAYGNLINARISNETTADVLPRLNALDAFAAQGKPVYAFSLITRVSNADDCVEEPLYWADYGTRFYRLSGLLHRQEAGDLRTEELETLAHLYAELPPAHIADWLQRRLRNHAVNLALIDLLARGRLSFLLVTSDDTSAWGMPSREKAWLESWVGLLGAETRSRLLVHPGADEVGSALVARFLCEHRGAPPKIYPVYAVPGGEEIIAPYEDRAVRLTVEGQIRACGGQVVPTPDDADILLGVLPPSPRRTEFRQDFADAERADRTPYYTTFFAQLGEWQREGRVVALGDVTYPNGADPVALAMLLGADSPVDPSKLAAYGAWNTAGNTLGTTVAQAVCSLFMGDDPARKQAQAAFLAHRFLEDYGYQAIVRREAREANVGAFGRKDPDPASQEQIDFTRANIETGLRRVLTEELQPCGIGAGLTLTPGSVRLPWKRTFEADFDLVPKN
jgi:hypothetical protein